MKMIKNIYLVFIAWFLVSCNKSDENNSTHLVIEEVKILSENNKVSASISATDKDTIYCFLEELVDVKKIVLDIKFQDQIKPVVDPDISIPQDFSSPLNVTFANEGESKFVVFVIRPIPLISSVKLDIPFMANIDNEARKITFFVNEDADLTKLTPTFSTNLSEMIIKPQGPVDFSKKTVKYSFSNGNKIIEYDVQISYNAPKILTGSIFNNPVESYIVANGLQYEQHKFNDLFGYKQIVSLLCFDPSICKLKLKVAMEDPSKFSTLQTSKIAEKYKAFAAVNGGYYNTITKAPTAIVKMDEFIINDNLDLTYYTPGELESIEGVFVVYNNGYHEIRRKPADNSYATLNSLATQLLGAGPIFLINNQLDPIVYDNWASASRAQSAVGILKDGRTIFIVVDECYGIPDSQSISAGIFNPDMQKLMQQIGCRDALKLDGGGSSTMWIKNRGVMNYPSDNSNDGGACELSHTGERAIANIFCFTE